MQLIISKNQITSMGQMNLNFQNILDCNTKQYMQKVCYMDQLYSTSFIPLILISFLLICLVIFLLYHHEEFSLFNCFINK